MGRLWSGKENQDEISSAVSGGKYSTHSTQACCSSFKMTTVTTHGRKYTRAHAAAAEKTPLMRRKINLYSTDVKFKTRVKIERRNYSRGLGGLCVNCWTWLLQSLVYTVLAQCFTGESQAAVTTVMRPLIKYYFNSKTPSSLNGQKSDTAPADTATCFMTVSHVVHILNITVTG